MRSSWLLYAIVAVLGAIAGLVVAGLPDRDSAGQLVVAGSSVPATSAEPATEPEVTTATLPETTAAAADTTSAPTTAPPTTTTTPPTTEPPPPPPPVDRAAVALVVANGSTIGGIASNTAEALETIGWTDVRTADGAEIFGETVIYYVDGFGDAGNQLAADLGLSVFVVPIVGAPGLQGDADGVQLLLYLGEDGGVPS